ncbi:MAG: archease [Desulfobulbaceae bacterium]|nr:archease [Desulfobulbaceae bacterium]
MKPASWEHFHHMADIGVRGCGETLAAAFEQGALALTAVMTDPGTVAHEVEVSFELEEPDPEILFYDWLNAIIYEMSVRRVLFGRFEVTVKDSVLRAAAWGEAVDRTRHEPAVEVKGATFTELKVYRQKNGAWIAQCVVDV